MTSATSNPGRKGNQLDAIELDDELVGCLLTSGDIARLLDIDLKTVHNWVRLGHLSGLKTPGGHLRFHRAEVVRFMRRFGFGVPRGIGDSPARIALVGGRFSAMASGAGAARREAFPRLFDAVLAVAGGGCDTVVLDLDEFGIEACCDFVRSLRRRSVTRSLIVIGFSLQPSRREAFASAGGDVAVESPAELERVAGFLTGN